MGPAFVALAIGAGIALILVGTGVLLAVDNARATVRQVGANLVGCGLIGGGFAIVSVALRVLT